MQPDFNKLAENAYDAYVDAVGGKAFNGDPLPKFETMDETRRMGWVAAAKSAYTTDR